MNINQELARIDAEREAVAQQNDSEQAKVQEQMNALRERLRNGETTGDPIKDHIILVNSRFFEEHAKPYYAVRDKVDRHEGDLVLLVLREERDSVCAGPGSRHEPFMVTDTELRLGVLNGGMKITEEAGGVDIETGKYVHCSDSYHSKGWKLEESDIPIRFLEFYHFTKPLLPQFAHMWERDHSEGNNTVHLYVGQEVEDYFCPKTDPRILPDEMKLHWHGDARVQNYAAALDMLKVTSSEAVQANKDDIRFKQQATLIEKLTESVRKGDVKETRSSLAKALVMGLHEGELKLPGDNGVIDVPQYVATLCQAYGMKV